MRPFLVALFLICSSAATADAQLFRGSVYGKCGNPACRMCYPQGACANGQCATGIVRSPVVTPASQLASTPKDAFWTLLDPLELGPDDVLYEPGCGDARVLIAACKRYGCRAVGIEIDPSLAEKARRNVVSSGVKARICTGDARLFSYDGADAAVLYLKQDLVDDLFPKLRHCRVVSYMHPLPVSDAKVIRSGDRTVYLYKPMEKISWSMFGDSSPYLSAF